MNLSDDARAVAAELAREAIEEESAGILQAVDDAGGGFDYGDQAEELEDEAVADVRYLARLGAIAQLDERECDHADCGDVCGYGDCGDCPECGSLSPWRCGCLDEDGNPVNDEELGS